MQLAPVHIIQIKEHKFNLHSENNCPSLKGKVEKAQKRQEVKDFQEKLIKKFGETLKKLANKKSTDFLKDYWEAYKYADTYIVDEADGDDFQILKDIDPNFDFELFKNYSIEFLELDYFGTNYFSNDVVKLSVSYMMMDILDYMDAAINNQTKIKLLAYSAHDTNMAGFELFNEMISNKTALYSPFASNSFYELFYDSEDQEYKVSYMFNDVVKYIMPYKDFKEAVMKSIMTDEEVKNFCKFEVEKEIKPYTGKYKHITFGFCVADALLLAMFVFIVLGKSESNERSVDDIEKQHQMMQDRD